MKCPYCKTKDLFYAYKQGIKTLCYEYLYTEPKRGLTIYPLASQSYPSFRPHSCAILLRKTKIKP